MFFDITNLAVNLIKRIGLTKYYSRLCAKTLSEERRALLNVFISKINQCLNNNK